MATNLMDIGLINFEVYEDGVRYLGESKIELPKMAAKTIEVSGAGIAGQMDFPTTAMFENMEIVLNFRAINKDFIGMNAPIAHRLTFCGAQQQYDAATGEPIETGVKILVRTLPKELNPGTLEQAASTESSITLNIDYIKIWLGRKCKLEFDRFNYKYVVDGVDYTADIRKSLRLPAGTGNNAVFNYQGTTSL